MRHVKSKLWLSASRGGLPFNLEIEVLQAYAKANHLKLPTNLGETVRLVARLGGYPGRKHDPPPGHQLMW